MPGSSENNFLSFSDKFLWRQKSRGNKGISGNSTNLKKVIKLFLEIKLSTMIKLSKKNDKTFDKTSDKTFF